MRFQDIIGQDAACTQIRRAYANRRLSHAYIFDGPSGTGKLAAAKALASLLLCEAPLADDSCGHCGACLQVQQETHPDLHLVEPDGASIKIKQIRQLRAALATTSTYGGSKVVIVDQADLMGIEAANAFLKTIEEPVGDTCFILVTTRLGKLPETIRSRAQLLRFRPLSEKALQRLLKDRGDAETVALAAHLANGSLKNARALLENDEERAALLARKERLETLLGEIVSLHPGKLLRFCQEFSSNQEAARADILLVRRHYRDAMHAHLEKGLAPTRDIAILHATTAALARLETNTDPAHILSALFIQIARLTRA